MNSKKLYSDHKKYLNALYPSCDFQKNKIQFRNAHFQKNNVHCGIFKITFAVTLAFNFKPRNRTYDIHSKDLIY